MGSRVVTADLATLSWLSDWFLLLSEAVKPKPLSRFPAAIQRRGSVSFFLADGNQMALAFCEGRLRRALRLPAGGEDSSARRNPLRPAQTKRLQDSLRILDDETGVPPPIQERVILPFERAPVGRCGFGGRAGSGDHRAAAGGPGGELSLEWSKKGSAFGCLSR